MNRFPVHDAQPHYQAVEFDIFKHGAGPKHWQPIGTGAALVFGERSHKCLLALCIRKVPASCIRIRTMMRLGMASGVRSLKRAGRA